MEIVTFLKNCLLGGLEVMKFLIGDWLFVRMAVPCLCIESIIYYFYLKRVKTFSSSAEKKNAFKIFRNILTGKVIVFAFLYLMIFIDPISLHPSKIMILLPFYYLYTIICVIVAAVYIYKRYIRKDATNAAQGDSRTAGGQQNQ